MLNKIKNWLLGAIVAIAFALTVVGALSHCKDPVHPSNGKRVDSVLVIHRDTIRTIDTLLKKKIIYRDTGRIEYIHDDLDKEIPPIGDENVCIAENQLRECMKCKDSLEAYKQIVAVDSQTIDTLSKLAKRVDTIKACTITEQAKSFGLGALFGIAIKSLF